MADKAISELVAAESVQARDLFVLEQDGAAKKLPGQTLENWLLQMAEGHGGIQSIAKVSTSGLVDTYRITLADTSTVDFTVTNGRSITGIAKTGTSGLVDTYQITFNSGSPVTFTVTNGAKGDKGDNAHTWIKYASQEPTDSSHSMGDIPDAWMGIYTGLLPTAPTDWRLYKWDKIKGDKGDTGDPAQLVSSSTTYMVSDSGTIIPSGSWQSSVPTVPQGKYLWTRVITTYNTGSPVTSYSVARMGIDGSGAVSTVNSQTPDSNGNVKLTAAGISTASGQSIQADLDGKQPSISATGLLKAADGEVSGAVHGVDYQLPVASVQVTLPASGWQSNAQTVTVPGVTADSAVVVSPAPESFEAYAEAECRCTAQGAGTLTFACGSTPAGALTVNVMVVNK